MTKRTSDHRQSTQLVRSDLGDGGWSIHQASATDEEIAEGIAPILASGTARWDAETETWDRPDESDEATASTELCRDGFETIEPLGVSK